MASIAAPRPYTEKEQNALIEEHWRRCNQTISDDFNIVTIPGESCPPVWDTLACWNRTPAGHLAVQPCPRYVIGIIEQANASRQCLENGSWYYHAKYNKEWTDYMRCLPGPGHTVTIPINQFSNDTLANEYVPALKILAQVGYSISLISLLAAFLVFACIKRLRCPRNVLHMNLFMSFILRAFMALLKDTLFVAGFGLPHDVVVVDDGYYFNKNEFNWVCRLIVTVWNYGIIANYVWILMEGLYLHNLIFLALFSDSSSITPYVALGWGLPVLFVIPWAICRALLENTWCWTTNKDNLVYLLIEVPVTGSVILNFILFVNIIRVLLLKLKSSVCEETKTFRRWAKSTLVLVPLFGVHYMIFLGLRLGNPTVEITWLFCDQIFACFNGFFVAVLYCFLNGEVRSELAKRRAYWSLEAGMPLFLSSLGRRRRSRAASGVPSSARPADGHHGNKDEADAANGSCYSSTAYTSVSMLPAAHCCNPGRKRSSPQAQVKIDAQHTDEEVKETSPKSQDRRWSVSDYNLEKNALELRCMTSPNNLCVKL